ncbi:MAG TPA: N,N-dimethylformamidase beta subunit family domain-containing protein [Solirubrobacteraceae bacterium]|nr:N,N-dimethylformamidase beta subunit family domain-containing protein [Solirubrobacteraceae bacterium]
MSRLPFAAFGALVVATVGAFFVTQHIKVKTPLFTGVGRRPAAISPLHGGVCGTIDHRIATVTFYLQHRSDDVSVYVIDDSGNIVRTLAAGEHMRGGAHPVRKYFPWNGREDSGKVAPDGTYYIRIALLGQGRTIDETGLPIEVKSAVPRPVVTNVSPSVVAPGRDVTISYTGTERRSGFVQIYRTDVPQWWLRGPVKTFRTSWNGSSAIWDGKIRGRPAPPGTYLVGYAVVDRACNTGQFPARLPPAPGTTAHAGVTIRYLAAEPTISPHPAGSRAFVLVDSRGQPYAWALRRAGTRKAVAHGTASSPLLHVLLPGSGGAGLYVLSLRSGAHRTAVPLAAAAAGAGARAKLLVVLPMLTWQGQNPVDDDGDGIPNTLDAGSPIRLSRPFTNGLPSDFPDVAAFLAYLDRAHLPYDLTTDVALARGTAPQLGGHKAVVFAGDERWLPGSLSALVRAFVQNGGNVLSLGIDSLRRTVSLSGATALSPTPPSATDIFGARVGAVVPRGGQLILTIHDGLGIFTTTSQTFPGYNSFQPTAIPSQAVSGGLYSTAGTSTSTTSIVGFKDGRGTVVEVGLPRFGTSLAHNVDAEELVRQLWTVLGR